VVLENHACAEQKKSVKEILELQNARLVLENAWFVEQDGDDSEERRGLFESLGSTVTKENRADIFMVKIDGYWSFSNTSIHSEGESTAIQWLTSNYEALFPRKKSWF